MKQHSDPYQNSISIDWLRFKVHLKFFQVLADYMGIPTDPNQWDECKRFNREYGCYLMEGVSVWADDYPRPEWNLQWDRETANSGNFKGDGFFIVDFSGNGLAHWGKEHGETPLDLLRNFAQIDGGRGLVGVNRLDVAFDDHEGYLDIHKIGRMVANSELVVTRWNRFEWLISGQIGQGDINGGKDDGKTLYLGSRLSDAFARVYDKLAEVKAKMNREQRRAMADELPNHWIRFELEFKRKQAEAVAAGMLKAAAAGAGQVEEFLLGVLRGRIDFKATTGDNRIRRRAAVRWWDRFTRSCAAVPIRVPRPAMTIERIYQWMKRTVVPSVALLQMFNGGMDWLERMIPEGIERLDNRRLVLLTTHGGQVPESDFIRFRRGAAGTASIRARLATSEHGG